MPLAHVTQTGNVSIPKAWRDELGIEPNSEILIERKNGTIIIEPLKKKSLADAFNSIDEEIKRKGITISRKEAVKDDFYD